MLAIQLLQPRQAMDKLLHNPLLAAARVASYLQEQKTPYT
jgi:hypothetical protein